MNNRINYTNQLGFTLVSEVLDQTKMDSNEDTRIATISLKIPIWFEDTTLWLKQVESAFEITRPKITSEKTKYYHILNNLPPHILKIVSDKLDAETPTPYTTLVTAIKERTRSSSASSYNRLVNITLDNRRPYELLAELRRNSENLNGFSYEMLREAFIKAMPDYVRRVLIPMLKTTSLDTLAEIADHLISAERDSKMSSGIHSIEQDKPSEGKPALEQQIAELQEQIASLSYNGGTSYQQKLCFYHRKFGYRAFRCVQPCQWRSSRRPTMRGNYRRQFQGN